MATIKFDDFTWFSPKSKSSPMAITIPNQDCLNFNQKAMRDMPECVGIGIPKTGFSLCIRKQAEGGAKLPKNGTAKDKSLISSIVATGVCLPARYELHEEENCWIAELVETSIPKVTTTPRRRKISKDCAAALIEEIKSL